LLTTEAESRFPLEFARQIAALAGLGVYALDPGRFVKRRFIAICGWAVEGNGPKPIGQPANGLSFLLRTVGHL
jgi:hypothetical protein